MDVDEPSKKEGSAKPADDAEEDYSEVMNDPEFLQVWMYFVQKQQSIIKILTKTNVPQFNYIDFRVYLRVFLVLTHSQMQ